MSNRWHTDEGENPRPGPHNGWPKPVSPPDPAKRPPGLPKKKPLEVHIDPTFPTRHGRLYGCARRGCDAVHPDYESFVGGGKGYCLHHIPLRYRLKVWWQERWHA